MNEIIKVIIADDHPMFRSGVKLELEKNEKIKIIAEADNGQEALKLIKSLKPDVAILDFQMPIMNGIEIVENLKSENISTKIILLTMHNEQKIFLKAIEAGISGYVLKDDAVLDIVSAVTNVLSGGNFISSKLTGLLFEKIKKPKKDESHEKISGLTFAEKRILKLISELNSNDEISEKLFISKRTVENQRVIISKKLNLEGAKELLKFAAKYRDFL